MASTKDGSVAPKERVNITYKSQTGSGQEDVELPLKVLMMGDFSGESQRDPVSDRKPINVDKTNFSAVMASQKIKVAINVPDKVAGQGDMAANLSFNSMKDFEPEGIVNQVPELKKLLELRAALNSLRGPLQNKAAFRKRIQELVADPGARTKLMAELGLSDEGTKTEDK
jgi:type VI secretion system protein ImpB